MDGASPAIMIEVGETLFTVGSRMLILVFLESQIVLESERFQLGYQRSRSRFESTLLSGGL